MSKKLLLIPLVAIIIGGAVFIFLTVLKPKSGGDQALKPNLGLTNYNSVPTPVASEKQEIYKDSAGISFSYYSGVTVKDITPNENKYYTLLSLTSADNKVQASIDVTDTTYKTVADLVAKDTFLKGATLSGASTLISNPASEYTLGNSTLMLTIKSGILYKVTMANNTPESKKTYDLIVASLSIGDSPKTTTTSTSNSSNSASDSDTVYEEEEVVE